MSGPAIGYALIALMAPLAFWSGYKLGRGK